MWDAKYEWVFSLYFHHVHAEDFDKVPQKHVFVAPSFTLRKSVIDWYQVQDAHMKHERRSVDCGEACVKVVWRWNLVLVLSCNCLQKVLLKFYDIFHNCRGLVLNRVIRLWNHSYWLMYASFPNNQSQVLSDNFFYAWSSLRDRGKYSQREGSGFEPARCLRPFCAGLLQALQFPPTGLR